MDRDDVAFPDANEIAPHAIAFARMMFAHAEFEREVRLLVDAINPKKPGFGERPENQWTASESGTGKIIILIKYHRGSGVPQTEQIKNLLNEAIRPSRDRNFLAHGTWWCFNRRTFTIEVRGGVRSQPELPPENRQYTPSDIEKLADGVCRRRRSPQSSQPQPIAPVHLSQSRSADRCRARQQARW